MPFTETLSYWLRDFWLHHADQRIASYWFVRNGMLPSVIIVSAYLVLTMVLLPKYMASREPMRLRLTMLCYNISMCIANMYFAMWAFVLYRFGQEWFNFVAPSQYDTSPQQMQTIQFMYIYMISKYIDLLDTFFLVLRKKSLTFLHLYHHAIVPIISIISFILHPTSNPVGIFAFFNSIVHSLIYVYLTLATLAPATAKQVWWKKCITQAEIVQFFIYSVFTALYYTFSQGYSTAYIWIAISQNPIFAYLFIRYYIQSYPSKCKQNVLMIDKRKN